MRCFQGKPRYFPRTEEQSVSDLPIERTFGSTATPAMAQRRLSQAHSASQPLVGLFSASRPLPQKAAENFLPPVPPACRQVTHAPPLRRYKFDRYLRDDSPPFHPHRWQRPL